MSAREYYEKYRAVLITEDDIQFEGGITGLFIELVEEMKELKDKRNWRGNASIANLVDEQNDKYNHVVKMLNRFLGFNYLKKDVFQDFCTRHLEKNKYETSII